MAQRRVTVTSPVGLHARPAAVFVEAVNRSGLAVTIAKVSAGSAGPAVDARSILSVLGLDVGCGDEVQITADGERAASLLEELASVVASQ